ncbi:MAG TPA: LuxR C-terminal-related transcriptional regulator [Pseudonocardiaceae bacterium]|jgi:non-specific serine/threonine protein kinase|nr:LuxR C-terminal-related transcriptional regulator [Pseudonocardiaceae bacterium]
MTGRATVDAVPAETTSYVGRRDELATARQLLGAGRIVTLTGVGGVGKTRLARRIAATVAGEYADGVAFVELAELRNAELLGNTVATKLGLHNLSSRPALDTIIRYLRDRHFLLVLDNCEHLIDACAMLVDALVTDCPLVTVLNTSRQSLDVPGEQLFPVPPLSVPSAEQVRSPADVERHDGPRLFLDRATAVLPSFGITDENYQDVVRVCHDLEGLPLAIELAAVRLRSLSLGQIRDRLTDRLTLLTQGRRLGPRRQQTLRALIDWSYELCSEPERLVLTRASVFSGGFHLDAVEKVCSGQGVSRADVLDIVHVLVDKSLLIGEDHSGVMRYRMLETMREYGLGELARAGDVRRVARLHRDWYADLAARYQAEWIGPDQVAWVERLTADHANIRVALDFCATEPAEAVIGLRIINQLNEYWVVRGFLNEARGWLPRQLSAAPSDAAERAVALGLSAWCAMLQGDGEAALAAVAQGRELATRIGDEFSAAVVEANAGYANLSTGQETLARDQFAHALAVFRAYGDARGEAYAAFMLGNATNMTGDFEKGRSILRDRIAASEAIGEIFWRSWALWALGMGEVFFGDPGAAEAAGLAAFRLQQVLSDHAQEAFTAHLLGLATCRTGDLERSATIFGINSTFWKAIGTNPLRFGIFTTKGTEIATQCFAALGETTFKQCYSRGRAMSREDAVRYILREAAPEPAPPVASPLTKREAEVAALIANGMTNKEIAATLFIAPRTAETHVDHIFTKLSFTSRAQIAAWVARRAEPPDRASERVWLSATSPCAPPSTAPGRPASSWSP